MRLIHDIFISAHLRIVKDALVIPFAAIIALSICSLTHSTQIGRWIEPLLEHWLSTQAEGNPRDSSEIVLTFAMTPNTRFGSNPLVRAIVCCHAVLLDASNLTLCHF